MERRGGREKRKERTGMVIHGAVSADRDSVAVPLDREDVEQSVEDEHGASRVQINKIQHEGRGEKKGEGEEG